MSEGFPAFSWVPWGAGRSRVENELRISLETVLPSTSITGGMLGATSPKASGSTSDLR